MTTTTDVRLGDVYRISDTGGPFMDAVIHRIYNDDTRGILEATVDLARPYCYASETGAPLVGVEMVRQVPVSRLSMWTRVSGNYAR